MRRTAIVLAVVVILTASLLASSGCDDPADPTVCSGGGRLQGLVSIGIPPEKASVVAKQVLDNGRIGTYFETQPDEQGHYSMDIPEGEYILEFRPSSSYSVRYDYTATGLGYGQVDPDTVTIDAAASPFEVDFHLGSLAVAMDLSALLEGGEFRVDLKMRDPDETDRTPTYQAEGHSDITNGRVDVQIPGVFPGEYRVEIHIGSDGYFFNCPYEGQQYWLPGFRDEEEATWYSVVVDSLTSLTAEIMDQPAILEGRITGAWKDLGLTETPSLTLVTPDSIPVMGLCHVDFDGGFSVPFFQPEPVKLLVYQEGVEQWIGGPGFAEATVFDPQPGQVISGIELVQSGLRLDARGDKLDIWGPRVMLYDPADMSLVATAAWSNGPDNLTGIPNLWPGDFLLYFTPDDSELGHYSWRPQWFDRATETGLAQVVTIGSPGEIVRLNLTFERGGTVSGVIEGWEDAESYRSAFVAPVEGDVSWGKDYIFSDQTTFRLAGLPDGDYRIGVTPPGIIAQHGMAAPEGTIWYPGTPEWSEATIVEIRDGGDIEGLVITLE